MSDDLSADLAAVMQSMDAPSDAQPPDDKPEATAEIAAEEKTGEEAATVEDKPEDKPEDKKPVRAPEGLKPEFKVRFAELDPEWQEEILRREQDAARGISQLSEQAKLSKELDRVIAPYEPMMQLMGAPKTDIIQNMLQTAYVLNQGSPEQKSAVVRGIMEQYGIQVDMTPPEEVSPELAAVRKELAELKQAIGQRPDEGRVISQQAATDVQAFAADPANEFFGEVRESMAMLMRAGGATDLKDAYEKACLLNPDVRKAQEIKKQRQGLAEQARAAKAAKEAGRQVSGSGPVHEAKSAHDDPRDDLRALFDKQA